jgi:hypothetical protein
MLPREGSAVQEIALQQLCSLDRMPPSESGCAPHLETDGEQCKVLLFEGCYPVLQAGRDPQHEGRQRCKDLPCWKVQINELLGHAHCRYQRPHCAPWRTALKEHT